MTGDFLMACVRGLSAEGRTVTVDAELDSYDRVKQFNLMVDGHPSPAVILTSHSLPGGAP